MNRPDAMTIATVVLAVVAILVIGVYGLGLAVAIGLARWLARGMRGA